jgi:hypothetical protein
MGTSVIPVSRSHGVPSSWFLRRSGTIGLQQYRLNKLIDQDLHPFLKLQVPLGALPYPNN